jgi:hypothetical protein
MFNKIVIKQKCHCEIFAKQLKENFNLRINHIIKNLRYKIGDIREEIDMIDSTGECDTPDLHILSGKMSAYNDVIRNLNEIYNLKNEKPL